MSSPSLIPDNSPCCASPGAQTTAPRNIALDGLRGVAILLVFLVHWSLVWGAKLPPGSEWARAASMSFAIGNSGVDLFFLLSGYLIYDTYLKRRSSPWNFLAKRLWRIYPAYLMVFALYLALSIISPGAGKLPGTDMATAAYLVRCLLFMPGILQEQPLVGTAWSLSYEMAFYLALPVIVAAGGLRSASPGKRVAIIVSMAALLTLSACATGLHERLLMFPAGMLIRELALADRAFVRGRMFATVAVLAMGAAVAAVIGSRAHYPFADPPFEIALLDTGILAVAYGVLLLGCVVPGTAIRRLFEVTWLEWLGTISYSFFLVHNLPLRVIARTIIPASPAGAFWLISMPLALVLVVALAWLLHVAVERRFMRSGIFARISSRTPQAYRIPLWIRLFGGSAVP